MSGLQRYTEPMREVNKFCFYLCIHLRLTKLHTMQLLYLKVLRDKMTSEDQSKMSDISARKQECLFQEMQKMQNVGCMKD